MLSVFVYGTLKPGYANYQAYCGESVLAFRKAKVRGQLFDLPVGYPAMMSGTQWVQGYLLQLCDDTVLLRLDQLEDYQPNRPEQENEYLRRWVEVFDEQERSLGGTWAYFMSAQNIRQHLGEWVVTGDWQPRF
jgi:gamma-glutamylcyclotransferase (GGCT)/AIG2-like uncharacterized protein YtfP